MMARAAFTIATHALDAVFLKPNLGVSLVSKPWVRLDNNPTNNAFFFLTIHVLSFPVYKSISDSNNSANDNNNIGTEGRKKKTDQWFGKKSYMATSTLNFLPVVNDQLFVNRLNDL